MAHKNEEQYDTYIIPPNFIESGSIFGGMFKLRNALEAGAVALLTGFPIFGLSLALNIKIILLCLTALPGALLALIGINGESLSSFILNFFRFLFNRRIIREAIPEKEEDLTSPEDGPTTGEKTKPKNEIRELKRQLREARRAQKTKKPPTRRTKPKAPAPSRSKKRKKDLTVSEYLPIEKIEQGIIYTRDHRFIKIIEVIPLNFLLRSAREQRNIIYSFVSFLKISPVKMQFKILTKKADINKHLKHIHEDIEKETDEKCKTLQQDYEQLIRKLGSKEAITRRFFIIFEYEPFSRWENNPSEAVSALHTAVNTAKTFLLQCGNEVISHDDEDEFTTEVLYHILNRKTGSDKPLSQRAAEVMGRYLTAGREAELDNIPVTEFIAPESIDFTRGKYVLMDGVYHSYLLISSGGYKPRVTAGWLSLLVNAGDGIDVDLFFHRQPKDRIMQKLGQQLRINRSKIKDTSDTNSDFDNLESAIQSGYFLKEGLANNEDFYYMNTLVTITAESAEELEWRTNEMKKLMISQDLDVVTCTFRQEQAFLSALPLISLEKKLYEQSKRNVLTTGVASCYPFTSFEMCDDNGILLGVNKHNNSLIIVDIFNSKIYKNANMAIMGTSGAGKTYTMQLMALRMRRKNIQVFVVAPLKGHEFHRACQNIGGSFIQISPASRNCINVMAIRKTDNSVSELLDGPTIDRSELAAKIQRLHIFFSLLIPDMNHEEKQLLDEALIKTYAAKGITHNNDSLLDPKNPDQYKEMPILGDLYEVLIKNPETKRLAHILNRLVNGSASSFNQQTNVDLGNKYIVLDISELSGDLLTVGMFVALDVVWDRAKENRTEEKAIFVDETWQLIGASSNRLAAEFVLEIFKIIRGYGGSAICATQDLNDFFALEGGKYGKGILNNSKTKIVLNLEDEEAQRVQEALHLSEAEIMAITHFERGNGLISTNSNNITVEFKASTLEGSLITSDRRELQELIVRQNASEA
ncbi:MAG: ATP-binding protein [Oscillospiraceae bacterium]|jgi:type IV secretory pathway VirB4 component|nr:ATP-binding protein [Oscillospiraceae bacterium]